MTNFTISIVSDTVCPWCYVGQKKLELAIALYKRNQPENITDTFTTTWHPFYLNPSAPKPAMDKRAFYAQKFGPERTRAMFERLGAVGRDVGITFSFGGKTGATRDSHRLIQLGKKTGAEAQTKVVQGLFEAYFERERDITDWAVLQDVGVKAGLGEEQARAWLEGDLGGSEVDREVEEARVKGINGVPHFTIQGVHELGGAQDPEAFVRVFEKVKGMEGK